VTEQKHSASAGVLILSKENISASFLLLENVVGISTFLLHGSSSVNLLFHMESYTKNNFSVAVVTEILPFYYLRNTHLLFADVKMLCQQISNEDRN